jgi:sec-independent protein translocase protein TatB
MFGFAWSELLLIGAVALVVIGPKDLPKVMRAAAQWSKKLRLLANDFKGHVDEMVRQAELDEIKREAEKAMDVGNIGGDIEKAIGVSEIENSLKLDEASAAADLPALPVESVSSMPPPEATPPAEPVSPEPVATTRPAGDLSELPPESVGSMPPPAATRETTP